jgi:predicted dehydrogenase
MIDILQMAFGDAMPRAITALGGKYWVQDNSETPDTMQVSYEYPDFLGSWEHRCGNVDGFTSRLMGLQFHGSRGTLYVDRNGFDLTAEKGSDLKPEEAKVTAHPHPAHWANFIECVKSRKRPNSDIETCVRSTATTILGNLAYWQRMRADWEDARFTTVQGDLRPYLHREYRDPWKLEL